VEGHVVERDEGEEDTRIACVMLASLLGAFLPCSACWRPTDQVRDEQEDVLLVLFVLGGAHRGAVAVDGLLCRGHGACVLYAGNRTGAETARDFRCSRPTGETESCQSRRTDKR
jgi:hypothetical protein